MIFSTSGSYTPPYEVYYHPSNRSFKRKFMAIFCVIAGIIFLISGLILFSLFFQPQIVIDALSRTYPRVLFSVDTNEKVIALTIDDVPSGQNTEAILDILESHNCKATFFVIGSMIRGREHILNRILLSGNEIGNHMMTQNPSISLNINTFQKNLINVQHQIESLQAYQNRKNQTR